MYWNNPLITVTWPTTTDPIVESMHQEQHCLFWNPAFDFKTLPLPHDLQFLCDWANTELANDPEEFFNSQHNHYNIANLVKLNMWISSMRKHGIVKPFLLLDEPGLVCGTGESRLRCLQRLPQIHTTKAFISTSKTRAHLYQDLEPVTSFDQFAQLCGAQSGQEFLFRLTDPTAPYGLYWYEFNSETTRSVTPGDADAVELCKQYVLARPGFKFSLEWFDSAVWPTA